MENRINVTELSKTLSDVLSRVYSCREKFVIESDGEPLATLAPVGPEPGISLGEFVERLGHLRLPGDGFAGDLETLQSNQPKEDFPAWGS